MSTTVKPTIPGDHASFPRDTASITAIVPVRNEEQYIRSTLDQLLNQQRMGIRIEILVLDGRSTDRTREIVNEYAKKHPEVRLLDNPGRLSSAGRNIGIRESSGEYVVIIDGHCEIPTRTYFRDLVEAFECSGADCLGRPQPIDTAGATPRMRAISFARTSWLGHHPDSLIYSNEEIACPAISVAVAYRRAVFDVVGPFDERFDACEDCDLNHRIDKAGLLCRLIPSLAVKYKPRSTLLGLFRQMRRYGRGRVRLLHKHSDTFSVASLAPAAFAAFVLAALPAIAVFPSIRLAYAAIFSIYVGVVAGVTGSICARYRSFQCLFWLPIVFVTIHLGIGIGSLCELIQRTRFRVTFPPISVPTREDASNA